jgi:hypothetical protein
MMATLGAFGQQRYCIDGSGAFDLIAVEEESARGKPVAILGTALAFLHLCDRGIEAAVAAGEFRDGDRRLQRDRAPNLESGAVCAF